MYRRDSSENQERTSQIIPGVSCEASRFALNALRLAFRIPPDEFVAIRQLGECTGSYNRLLLAHASPFANAFVRFVQDLMKEEPNGGKWPWLTIGKLAVMLSRQKVPRSAEADRVQLNTPFLCRLLGTNMDQFAALASREELPVTAMVTSHWPELAHESSIIEIALQEFEGKIRIPVGFLRPQDVVVMDEDDVNLDLVRDVSKAVKRVCNRKLTEDTEGIPQEIQEADPLMWSQPKRVQLWNWLVIDHLMEFTIQYYVYYWAYAFERTP